MNRAAALAVGLTAFTSLAAKPDAEIGGFALQSLTRTEIRESPVNPNDFLSISRDSEETALLLEGQKLGVTGRVRASGTANFNPGSNAAKHFTIEELNRVFAIGDDWSLSIGNGPRNPELRQARRRMGMHGGRRATPPVAAAPLGPSLESIQGLAGRAGPISCCPRASGHRHPVHAKERPVPARLLARAVGSAHLRTIARSAQRSADAATWWRDVARRPKDK